MKQNISELVAGLASIGEMVDAVQAVYGGDCYVDAAKEFDLHLKDGSTIYFTPQKDGRVLVMLWRSEIDDMTPIWEFTAPIGARVLVPQDAIIAAITAALVLAKGRTDLTMLLRGALCEAEREQQNPKSF